MKAKLIAIICVMLVLAAILFGLQYKNGFNGASTTNPMSSYDSIADLQRSVNFEFQIPAIVSNGKNLKLFNYLGSMVEIQSDDFTFRAAPFVADGADVSGDYSTYNIDKEYIDESGSIKVRYRSNEQSTLINLTMLDMSYSIKFNAVLDEIKAFEQFGINTAGLVPYNKSEIIEEDNHSSDGDKLEKTEDTNEKINTPDNNELTFRIFEDKDMGISFMIPSIVSDITGVYSNNQLAIMLGNKVVFVIEYYEDGYSADRFNGFTLKEINESYLIRYIINNEFEKDSQLYKDYYTLIENIDTVANTFNNLK